MAAKVLALIYRRGDLDPGAFVEHWTKKHGNMVRQLPALRGYVQNIPIGSPDGEIPYDGVVELRFDDIDSFERAFASADGLRVSADRKNFIRARARAFVEERVILGQARDASRGRSFKLISVLTRRADLTPDEFIRYWTGNHVHLVRRLPGLRRYVINLPQEGPDGPFPYDGIVELWFESRAALEYAFSSPVGRQIPDDNANFMGRTDRIFAQERVVIDGSSATPSGGGA
jgi:uncharacterized protein (TIGR02118 family)